MKSERSVLNDFFGFSPRQLRALTALVIVSAVTVVATLIGEYTQSASADEGLTIYVGGADQTYEPVIKVDINSAPADSLELVPGIGPVFAERIVTYRDSVGGFERISDITRVRGIGVQTYERVKPYLKIGQ